MRIVTDDIAFAERLTPGGSGAWKAGVGPAAPGVATLVDRLFAGRPVHAADVPTGTAWPVMAAAGRADRSQFDTLVALSRTEVALPDGTLCLAGAGSGLHGQRGRAWAALAGNLHLSLWLAPPGTGTTPLALLAMAAVSIVEAIDHVPGLEGRAGIKWVNDILLDDAKVCGILTHIAHRESGIVGVVGIGLNVESVPDVPATPFVPAVTALRAAAATPDTCRLGAVLPGVLEALDRNYASLRGEGPERLFARYRERSLVVGRRVAVCGEDAGGDPTVLVEGRVSGLGPHLELLVEGHPSPITTGRLRLVP